VKYKVDEKQLSDMYLSGMTTRQIGAELQIPFRTVTRYLKNIGVEMRNSGGFHKPALDDADWLRSVYEAGNSTTQIAEMLGSTSRTVYTWLVRHGIETRARGSEKGHERFTAETRQKLSEAKRGKFLGADNPNWKGGLDNRDPERNRYPAKQWSKAVKERDGFACVECGETEKLHSHHIKRWMDYPELRYELDNGVTLCEACHQKAHGKGFVFQWNHTQKSTRVRCP